MSLRNLIVAVVAAGSLEAAISYISIGAGMFDISRAHPQTQIQLEYRSGYRFWVAGMPFAGVMSTMRGSAYLFGGVAADLVMGGCISFIPSFAVGLYTKGGGKNLYYPLEFRSAIEGCYIFKNKMRLGLQFSHISNANLGHHNPGEESLILMLSVPLQRG